MAGNKHKRGGQGISLILTVFNEEDSIIPLLTSVSGQTHKPDEVVIVDAGSTDRTRELINNFKKANGKKLPIRLIMERGANIPRGRNVAIKNAKHDLIFSADAGTIFEKRWIEKLLKGFNEGCDIAVGEYVPAKPGSLAEEVISTRFPDFSNVNSGNVIPSNRQAAYRKKVWDAVGGFPEELVRADDNVFFSIARQKGFKFYFTREAKVYWHTRARLSTCLRLAFRDSKSEGFFGIIWWQGRNLLYSFQFLLLFLLAFSIVASVVIHPLVFPIFLIVSSPIFMVEGGLRAYNRTKKPSFFVHGSVLSFLLFLSHSTGAMVGMIERVFNKQERWKVL